MFSLRLPQRLAAAVQIIASTSDPPVLTAHYPQCVMIGAENAEDDAEKSGGTTTKPQFRFGQLEGVRRSTDRRLSHPSKPDLDKSYLGMNEFGFDLRLIEPISHAQRTPQIVTISNTIPSHGFLTISMARIEPTTSSSLTNRGS